MDKETTSHIVTVNVWTFETLDRERDCEPLLSILSPEEVLHASLLHFPSDRARYLSAHAGVRQLLACALSTSPEALVIERSAAGKPFLASAPLHFNLSHSGVFASVAISTQVEVGVDIEQRNTAAVTDDLLRQFLSPPEHRWLDHLPAEERADTFFTFWTLKEALIKAEGSGVSHPMHEINTLECISSAVTARCSMPGEAKISCFATSLDAPPGYAAAVATTGRAAHVHHSIIPSRNGFSRPAKSCKKHASAG